MISYFNNTPIHYTITGEGPPLVLLHGFLLSGSIWAELAPKLTKNNKVIVIDLPGHGKSGCVAKTHSMKLMAEVVNFILEENSISKTSFIGHSMGGYIALAFAEKYEFKTDTLVLLNSSSKADSLKKKKIRDRSLNVIKTHPELFIKMAIAALFPENTQEKHKNYINQFYEEAFEFPVEGVVAALKGMKNRKDRTSVLKNFTGKKYMISGIHDLIIPYSSSEKNAKKSNTELITVDSGHMSVNENIDEIIKIMHLVEFL